MSHRRRGRNDDGDSEADEDLKRRKSHLIEEDDFMYEEGDGLTGEEDVFESMIPKSWFGCAKCQVDPIDADEQDLFPSVQDSKLWMVKCVIGRERETAVSLMQKALNKGHELQIRSAIALNNLKIFIYVEADKEAHVREACKGLHVIYASTKIAPVPIDEMSYLLSVKISPKDLARDSWVRVKCGTYKGDLAKVVDVDNVHRLVTIKLIPRIDVVALANKLKGKDVTKKKAFVPLQGFMNVEEARKMNLRVERRWDPRTCDFFENINGMNFKDGFLYALVPINSITIENRHPTFDELEKFRQPRESGDGDFAGISTLFSKGKKGHFMKGDKVIVDKGDLKNLKGKVEKVEEGNVHIGPNGEGLPPSSSAVRAFEGPTPGLGWANTPSGSYAEAGTSRDAAHAYGNAPIHALPSTSGGQPMTPGVGVLNMMSPAVGGDNGGIWALPDVLVTVHKPGEDSSIGVLREVLPDASCKVALGSSGNGEVIIALPSEIKIVAPRKSNKIKIMGGAQRGATGKLIGIDGSDGIVKVDDTLDVMVLDMNILAKLVHAS